MQLLFLFLFGSVVIFILYLSFEGNSSDKKKDNDAEVSKIDLHKTSNSVETETDEKVVAVDLEKYNGVQKFKAKRNDK